MRLYVGNLPYEMTDPELKALVANFGPLKSCTMERDRNGLSKGFAFVEFMNDEDAEAAIEGLNGRQMAGRPITISEARNQTAPDILKESRAHNTRP